MLQGLSLLFPWAPFQAIQNQCPVDAQCTFFSRFSLFPFLPMCLPRPQSPALFCWHPLGQGPRDLWPWSTAKGGFHSLTKGAGFALFNFSKWGIYKTTKPFFFSPKYDGIVWESSWNRGFKAGWGLVCPWTGKEVLGAGARGASGKRRVRGPARVGSSWGLLCGLWLLLRVLKESVWWEHRPMNRQLLNYLPKTVLEKGHYIILRSCALLISSHKY